MLRHMGPAIIGLVGVVVGALVSGAASFLMARRGEQQQARAAARLLESELTTVGSRLRVLNAGLERGSDNLTDLRPLVRFPPQEAWQTHRANTRCVPRRIAVVRRRQGIRKPRRAARSINR
jgi:hypothetical protein